MARTPRGQIIERKTKRHGASYAVRFQTSGTRHFVTLGNAAEGWTRTKAEQELQNILARRSARNLEASRVRAGPRDRRRPDVLAVRVELAHANEASWSENTVKDYTWQVRDHFFRSSPTTV